MREPRTTKEHLISIYGHIEGLKKEIKNLKENHLTHMHEDIDKLGAKVDKLLFWLMSGMLTIIVTIIGLVAWIQ
jgi:predicted protein tyrosine phosphatase|tara:strand:- start:397 stop:618 length:222 start_codon:yes stop_codon:yes gene_type:complete